jgi:hypothetical protein
MARAVVPLVVFALSAALVFPFALGEARLRGFHGWHSEQGDLQLFRNPHQLPCIAFHRGELCLPVWTAPMLVAFWYRDQARRYLS